jgi:hypothetical protein
LLGSSRKAAKEAKAATVFSIPRLAIYLLNLDLIVAAGTTPRRSHFLIPF